MDPWKNAIDLLRTINLARADLNTIMVTDILTAASRCMSRLKAGLAVKKTPTRSRRIKSYWDARRNGSAEDMEHGADYALFDISWRRILRPLKLKRQSASTNGTPLLRQTSGQSTAPTGSFPQTAQSPVDITAYYTAKPLPPIPYPGCPSSKAYMSRSEVWPSISSVLSSSSSPFPSTTTCSSPVLRSQEQERLVLTRTSRYPVGIAAHTYEPENCELPKKDWQSLARRLSSRYLRSKPDFKELPPPTTTSTTHGL
ncbi:hypothetical protein EG328_009578 [Venturia inaequalis]|uniref:Uncharacterized protein n=1 Tax=Venturia inaequalis TaxID=5025 RepID=A0A8H3UCP4_VENIN|nr:hypothetical protein EG328_009578 [Venturia inaequalis]KAE9968101.1 hypothetical protein EG327_011187 [Venturia inaequalis]